jgi:hypothetical protein
MPSAKVAPAAPSNAQATATEEPQHEHALSGVTDTVAEVVSGLADLHKVWAHDELPDEISGPAGALVFTLHKGKDLLSADRNGFSDPYCIVKVFSSPTWRSKICFKTLNPEWNQSHDFEGYLADQTRKPIKIRVYDFDVVSLNDPIGNCEVDISALVLPGKEHALHFEDVALKGVAHGTISFSVHFELKPVFRLFPGTPVHASAAQALRRRPPKDASRAELFRDGLLRLLGRKTFLYMAILWLISLSATIGFVIVLYFAILLPVMMNTGTPKVPELSYAPWSREANLIGMSDAQLMHWANLSFQVCTALFSYLNGIAIPWRLSILLHHLSRRSSKPGFDFYGRETEAIWFHIPEGKRLKIAIFLNLSVFFHFATQATRFVWTDYIGSNDPAAGMIPVNVTFVLSIVFAICGGVVQGGQEKKLMALNPEKYPPGLGKAAKDVFDAWRRGEIKLCSLKALRELKRISKEDKAKFAVAAQLQKMKTEYSIIGKGRGSKAEPSEPSQPQSQPSSSSGMPSELLKGSPKGTVRFADGAGVGATTPS